MPSYARRSQPGPAAMRARGRHCTLPLCSFLLLLAGAARADEALPAVVEFNRDVRPILSDACFACHGPDARKRKADLRLYTAEGAFADLGEGRRPFVAGRPGRSEVYR